MSPVTTTTPWVQSGRRFASRAALAALLFLLLVAPAAIVLLTRDGTPPSEPRVRADEVEVGELPTDIAISQGKAWVTSAASSEVYALDDRPHPSGGTPYRTQRGALRVASDPLSVWVAGALGNSVTSLDSLFAGRARRHTVPVGADAVDVAVGRDGVWVSNGARGTVTRIDPVADRVIGPPIRTGRFPTALAVGSHDVWVVNSGDGTVARIDPREHLVVGRRVSVGRDPQDVVIGFGSVWVANRGDGTLSRIDERTGRPEAQIRVGGAPTALAVTTEAIVVLDTKEAKLTRLNPRSGHVGNVVRVGGFPAALAVGDAGALWTVDARTGTASRVSR